MPAKHVRRSYCTYMSLLLSYRVSRAFARHNGVRENFFCLVEELCVVIHTCRVVPDDQLSGIGFLRYRSSLSGR